MLKLFWLVVFVALGDTTTELRTEIEINFNRRNFCYFVHHECIKMYKLLNNVTNIADT